MQSDHGPSGVSLVQQAQHLLRLRLRAHTQCPLPGLGADGLIGEQRQHPGQLQGANGFVK